MANLYKLSNPPLKNTAFTFDLCLFDTDGKVKISPTLAAGDIQVSKDGGAFANIDSLPTEIGSTGVLKVSLTATEMNADRVAIKFHDTAGDEWVDLLVTFSTVQAIEVPSDPLTNEVPGTYLSGSAGHALGRIGAGQVVTTSVVAQSGAVTTIQGDDYLADLGRALDWVDAAGKWPDLTSYEISVVIDNVKTYAGEVIKATGDNKKVRLELTGAQTALIPEGGQVFQVIAALPENPPDPKLEVTLVEGAWISKRRFTEE